MASNQEILHKLSTHNTLNEAVLYTRHTSSYTNPKVIDVRLDRTFLINTLISKYRYNSYLEIGCRDDECFNLINCNDKVGVDPASGGTMRMTSDDFFQVNCRKFDIIFIDGLHYSKQVMLDIKNAVNCLSPNGTIVLHDCKPLNEQEAVYPIPDGVCFWNGDVWKAVVHAKTNPNIDTCIINADWGLGVIRVRHNTNKLDDVDIDSLTWNDYIRNFNSYINPKTFTEFLQWV